MSGEERRYEARYDADEQELLVTADLLAECGPLVSGGRGAERLADHARSALRSAGLLGDADAPVPLLTLVAETVDDAVVEIAADVATPEGTVSSLVVLGPASCLIAVPASVGSREAEAGADATASGDVGDLARIVLVPPDELPIRLLTLLDVQARPHLDAPAVKLPRGALDGLLAAPGEEAEDAVQQVFGTMDGLPDGMVSSLVDLVGSVRLHWSVTSSVPVDEATFSVRRYEVLDGGDAGWWFVHRADDHELLVPATGRDVLEALESLVPTDDELRELAKRQSTSDGEIG